MQPTMDSLVERELTADEQLLWFGRPTTHSTSRVNVFLILALTFGPIGILLLIIALILVNVLAGQPAAVAAIAPLIIGAVFLFLAILFGIFAITLRVSPRNLMYAITDQRLIIIHSGSTLTVDSYSKADIGPLRRIERSDGTGDLIFSTSRFPYTYGGSGYNGSNYGSYGNYNMNMSSSGRLIGLADVRATERLLRQALK